MWFLSMLGLKLTHVSKGAPGAYMVQQILLWYNIFVCIAKCCVYVLFGNELVDQMAYFAQDAYKPGCLYINQVIYTPATED